MHSPILYAPPRRRYQPIGLIRSRSVRHIPTNNRVHYCVAAASTLGFNIPIKSSSKLSVSTEGSNGEKVFNSSPKTLQHFIFYQVRQRIPLLVHILIINLAWQPARSKNLPILARSRRAPAAMDLNTHSRNPTVAIRHANTQRIILDQRSSSNRIVGASVYVKGQVTLVGC